MNVSPRAWVGAHPWPWPPATSIEGGGLLVACYSVSSVQLLRTRTDKPYVRMQLADVHGTVEGRIWDDAERFATWLRAGLFIGVRGRIEIFNGQRQLKVEEVAPVEVRDDDLDLFLPRSERTLSDMEGELRTLVASIADAPLRGLLRALLDPGTDTGRAFRRAPAAKYNHHAYVGGLMEHTLSVAGLCMAMADHYGDAIDRDLLLTGALLHDIGKIREIDTAPGFPYNDEGKLLGHILIGLELVADAARVVPIADDRLLLVRHLIASHQGRYEWQSPREPRILEGVLLHYADDLDAKINQVQQLIAAVPAGWTNWDRGFGRDFLRHHAAPGEPAAPPPIEDLPEDDDGDPLDLFANY